MDTHGPYEPPGEYATLYADKKLSGRDAQALYQRAIDDPESITDEERQLLIDLYDAEIRYNDEYIGEFLKELQNRDLLEDSLLIVTADHGDAFGEHGYYEHPRYLHDEITQIPMFVREPEKTAGTVETPVSTLDIVSTFKQIVGQDIDSDRVSLLDQFDDGRTVFLQARGEEEHSHIRRYALRTRDGSCFCEHDRESGSIEFGECSNRSLREDLEVHVSERVELESDGDGADEDEVDEEIERRLNALGYKE
jgi:arylsulfatase